MRRYLLLASILSLPGAAPATPFERTEVALRSLIAASSLPTASSSASCQGTVPGLPRPTLGDLLVQPLAGLDGGSNRINGGCARGACWVRITHRGREEDVFAYEFRFRVARGQLVPASLECFSTP